ncbi:Protein of unknown function [Gryllus bimaculatus]|nr:Protein of unknown function [Gryllus bimaculatus]
MLCMVNCEMCPAYICPFSSRNPTYFNNLHSVYCNNQKSNSSINTSRSISRKYDCRSPLINLIR